MEVTRSNFKKALPEIEEAINKCTFLAVDGEFTGLSSGSEHAILRHDTPAEYYDKTRNGSMDFLFIQFGLAAFSYDEELDKYAHRSYNFYVFPRPKNSQAPDCRFLCQSSSLDFLTANGFDFNKLLHEGIPYLNFPDERAMRDNLRSGGRRREGRRYERGFETHAEIDDAVGFSKVIRIISESGKLVVGHNMLLDLCHMVHRFWTPLPRSYPGFKQLMRSVFPHVLDTKLVCSCEPLADLFRSTALCQVIRTVQRAPFEPMRMEKEGQSYSLAEPKEHEAGYDAYVTGVVAIALSNYLRELGQSKRQKLANKLPSADSPHLRSFVNRLFLMKVQDYYIDLEGDDRDPDASQFVYVTFPQEWNLADIADVFGPSARSPWSGGRAVEYAGNQRPASPGESLDSQSTPSDEPMPEVAGRPDPVRALTRHDRKRKCEDDGSNASSKSRENLVVRNVDECSQ